MQQSRVEHYVAVVAHECVALLDVDVVEVGGDAKACLCQQILEEIVAKSLLKVEVGATLVHLHPYCLLWHTGIEIGKNLQELFVLQQSVEHFGQL